MVSQKKVLAALCVAAGLLSGVARADTYCSGPINEYLVYSDGTLMLYGSWRNDWTVVCNTRGTWNAITTETCFSWLAIVGSAKVHNKSLGIYYAGNLDCTTLATYGNAPSPVYLRLGN
jgi:hypothetical protein